MKLTETVLRKIIKEEISKISLNETEAAAKKLTDLSKVASRRVTHGYDDPTADPELSHYTVKVGHLKDKVGSKPAGWYVVIHNALGQTSIEQGPFNSKEQAVAAAKKVEL